MKESSRLFLFPDINVRVALSYDRHVHHNAARKWFAALAPTSRLFFCRLTQLGLLRLLSAPAVMGPDQAESQQQVKKTPVELPDQSITQASGQKRNYFGYEVEVPWEIDEPKSKQVGQMQLVALRSGNSLLVSRMAPKEFVKDFLSTGKTDPAGLRDLYGEEVLQSDYSLMQRILEATPEKVGLLTPRKEAAGNAMFLVIKAIMMPNGAESGIYQIRAGDFRGFQFGDPRSRPKSIDLEIYNQDGGLGFIFTQRQNTSGPAITQAQINRIIQSLQRLPNQN